MPEMDELVEEEPIVDLDADIKSVPELPFCDFCSTAYKIRTFETYHDLIQHRIDRHRSSQIYQPVEIPGIEVHLQREDVFVDAESEDIEAWADDLELILNMLPWERPVLQWELHYTQKNLLPLNEGDNSVDRD